MSEEGLFEYSLLDDETPSEGVIKTIANLEDCDPTALNPPLFAAIDPDILDQVYQPAAGGERSSIQITFEYNGYEVTVREGTVTVQLPTHPSTEGPA